MSKRLEEVARQYEKAAAELEAAVRHLRMTARHFRDADVPRAAALTPGPLGDMSALQNVC